MGALVIHKDEPWLVERKRRGVVFGSKSVECTGERRSHKEVKGALQDIDSSGTSPWPAY